MSPRKESTRDAMDVLDRDPYPWLRCTHGVWTAALSGASKAEQDRRIIIRQELQLGRLVLPPAEGAVSADPIGDAIRVVDEAVAESERRGNISVEDLLAEWVVEARAAAERGAVDAQRDIAKWQAKAGEARQQAGAVSPDPKAALVEALESVLGPIDTEEGAAAATEAVAQALGWRPDDDPPADAAEAVLRAALEVPDA